MLLTRWTPFTTPWWTQMQQLQGEMNRLLDRWGNRDGAPDIETFPAVNVYEESEGFVVEAELPGLDLKDVEIYVAGRNQLTIKGERKAIAPDKSVQHRQERGIGEFVRSLTLPSQVDENKVDARLDNGILTIRLPKHEAAKPRKISVKA